MTRPIDPTVTVAVPTYRGAAHLRETLVSILRSDTPHELLVVDDRSDDRTQAVAREVVGDRGRVVVNSERLGLAGNWNRCVALSRSPVVAIFHQDDLMLSGHLATHLEAYRRDPALGWVASAAGVIDHDGQPIAGNVVERGGLGRHDRDFTAGTNGGSSTSAWGLPEFTIGNPLRCSAVTINREAHAEVGGFDPSHRYVVDWDFWLRVARARPVAWRARTTVAVRWHPASETHRFAVGMADLDETARLLRQVGELLEPGFKDEHRWPVLAGRRLGRAYLNRAHVAFRGGDPTHARHALWRAITMAPGGTLAQLARDPRLLAQMTAALFAPGWVRLRGRGRAATPTRRDEPGGRLPDREDRAIMNDPP